MRLRSLIAVPVVALSLVAVSACSEDEREQLLDDGVELAVRNCAAVQGAEHLSANGVDLDGRLRCTATVSKEGRSAVDVSCTGATVDGGAVELTGRTAELPGASITELKGEFTATVDGETVFTTGELGG